MVPEEVRTMNESAAAVGIGGAPNEAQRRNGTVLALSGGGFRAALFHSGALRRLNELGILASLTTIASVSGGSLASGILALKWPALKASEQAGVFTDFDRVYAEAVRAFCRKDLRTEVLLWDRLNPGNWFKLASRDYSITDRLCAAYAAHLGMDVPLRSLPKSPQFLFLASNLETGACWRFESGAGGALGDYYTGFAPTGETTLATAVGASSAFPVVFPPLVLTFPDPGVFRRPHPQAQQTDETKRRIALTDGGVYDNLGLEPIWLHGRHILVSDAGTPFAFEGDPGLGLKARLARVFDVSSNQVEAVRKRWLIDQFLHRRDEVDGAYWGLGSDVAAYRLADAPGFRGELLDLLRAIRTDLNQFKEGEIGCLENHGYALADVAIRRWEPHLVRTTQPFEWPYPSFVAEQAVRQALADSAHPDIALEIWESLKKHTLG
jgi:NTE family protein